MEAENIRRRRRIRKPENPIVLGMYITFWVAVLLMFLWHFVSQMENYNELQAELSRINGEITVKMQEQERLEFELSFFDSDAYLEQLARERLGMARPNEIVFRNIAD
jgi:cell division protein FtsB